MEYHLPELPLIDRIKVAAQFFIPIVKEMEAELGRERAQAIVRAGIAPKFRAMAREAVAANQGDAMAALASLNAGDS